ncbi:hypothetical protein HK101_010756, partial [Irineochytrium annulatum]
VAPPPAQPEVYYVQPTYAQQGIPQQNFINPSALPTTPYVQNAGVDGVLRKLPLFPMCCGCVELRMGTMILAIVSIILNFIGIILAIVAIANGLAVGIEAFSLLISLAFLACDVIGLMGAVNRNPKLVFIYLITFLVRFGLYVLSAIITIAFGAILSFVLFLIMGALYVYWALCVWSFYADMINNPAKYGIDASGKPVVGGPQVSQGVQPVQPGQNQDPYAFVQNFQPQQPPVLQQYPPPAQMGGAEVPTATA